MKILNDLFRKPKDDEEKELFFYSVSWIETLYGGCQADQSWWPSESMFENNVKKEYQRMKEDIACDECPLDCEHIKEIDRDDWYSRRNMCIRYALAEMYLSIQQTPDVENQQEHEETHGVV